MSAVKSLFAAVLLSASFAGAAFARDAVFTVKVDAPVSESQVIAQNTVWSCEGDTCLARPDHAVSVRACRQFVRETGARVIAYGHEGRELSAAEIARCNGERITQQAQN